MEISIPDTKSAGYTYLIKKFAIAGIPHWHRSSISTTSTHVARIQGGSVDEVFRASYWPGDTTGDHLEFALKYDGVNLALLSCLFEKISEEELTQYVKSKPTGKYARRIWFFYEFLTGRRLPLDDLNKGNYVDALEAKEYYTVQNGERSSRHRIVNNLLGPRTFCPVVRRSKLLASMNPSELRDRCEAILTSYPTQLLRRALSYLYRKETKSSFEIERITPSASRIERFIAALQFAETEDFCNKERLIELQNRIVDPRFKDSDYRTVQNYVGQTISFHNEIIHYICPKPDDLPLLMQGLIDSHVRMTRGNVSPIVHAAVIAYGFVFLHPFHDGNGRIHRFLIHNILSLRNMVPRGLMFPVSAVMLRNLADYDASLEAFSKPLLQLIDYHMDELGRMTVQNESATWYQYMDMTAQTEVLYKFIIKTIEEELVQELNFLVNHDNAKIAIQNIIDMPDQQIDLFINLCLQHDGHLSARERSDLFAFLTDKELADMEQAVQKTYHKV